MVLLVAAFSTHEPEKDRDAPSQPTPIAFPEHEKFRSLCLAQPSNDWSANRLPLFAQIRKPGDVGRQHLESLNVKIEETCDPEYLLPGEGYRRNFLPPKSWFEVPTQDPNQASQTPPAPPVMSNGRPLPDHEIFYTRMKELLVDNETAYNVISRKIPSGQTPPRLAHFRRFWEGMDSLAHYWDTSADEYYLADPESDIEHAGRTREQETTKSTGDQDIPVVLGPPPPIPPRKKPKISDNVTSPANDAPKTVLLDRTASQPPKIPARTSSKTDPAIDANQADLKLPAQSNSADSPLRYRGHRIANGSQMPPTFLHDTVRAFVEACSWPHNCSITSPRRLPQIQISASQFSSSLYVSASTKDHQDADGSFCPLHTLSSDLQEHMDMDSEESGSSYPMPSSSTSPLTKFASKDGPRSGKLLLPLRMSALVYRTPNDRVRARSGCLEGPVMGIWTRSETGIGKLVYDPFESLSESSKAALLAQPPPPSTTTTTTKDKSPIKPDPRQRELLDVLNEFGILLFLAQERVRDGQPPKKPGEGQWYTSVPRWGGGEGGEVGNETGNSDDLSAAPGATSLEETPSKPKDERTCQQERDRTVAMALEARLGRRSGSSGTSSREHGRSKVSAAEAWKLLKLGSGHWDPRVEFRALGRAPASNGGSGPWDHVFLVSAMNHHVSLVRMRVHRQYLEWIGEGKMPAAGATAESKIEKEDEGWESPVVTRTRWWDLFNREDRMEAVRAVWGVLSYLMRGVEEEDGQQQ
jgi:hypothetical protein